MRAAVHAPQSVPCPRAMSRRGEGGVDAEGAVVRLERVEQDDGHDEPRDGDFVASPMNGGEGDVEPLLGLYGRRGALRHEDGDGEGDDALEDDVARDHGRRSS